ncbi:MAG: DUF4129 domain-containing protein [Dehalococcoidia bacterium]|nr:DUF4129 domain-containing protein [Dehalococcoidia bacterium]
MRNFPAVSYIALVVVESIQWFAVLAMIGGMIALGGSPIPWFALFLLFSVGMSSGWLFGGIKSDNATVALLQGAVALAAVYLTMANVTVTEGWSFKIAWPVDTFGGTYGNEGVADVMLGVVATGWVWYRSQSLVANGDVRGRLSSAFKYGTAFLAIALLVEFAVVRSDIGIAPLLLPFYGAALIGMAVSRLPQSADAGQASWPLIIGVSVGGILGVGTIAALLTGRYGDIGVRGMINAWGAFIDALLWVLHYPIKWMVTAIELLLLWLRERLGSKEAEEESLGASELSEDMVDLAAERAEETTEFVLEAFRWPLSMLLIVVLFFVLVFAYRRFSVRNRDTDDTDRESIRGDADARADMMKLLSSLMPGWMKGQKQQSLWKWPEGEHGVAEAFLLYFDTLAAAIKRGMVFNPNATPNERVTALAVFLPGAPVETVTSRFNAACYGAQPADLNEIERLRWEVEAAAKRPQPGGEE